jgi:hypothetical protein
VIVISRQKPVGFSFSPQPDRSVRYNGDAIDLNLAGAMQTSTTSE